MAAASPIRIVPLYSPELAAAPKAPPPHLTYRGGPLLGSAEVFTVFWGSAWAQRQDLVDQLNGFFDYVLTSPLMDQLGEYSVEGKAIGQGRRTGSLQAGDPDPGATVSDAQVQSFLDGRAGQRPEFPDPGPNTLVFVYLPSGTAVEQDGAASCSQFCGYHQQTAGGLFYAVMPAPDCSGCLGGLTELEALTSTSSHELCEAITDPVPGQGWYDDSHGEIGDICAWQTRQLGAYTVQLEWSNQAGACR